MYGTIALVNHAVETLGNWYFKEAVVDGHLQGALEHQVQLVQLPRKILTRERADSELLQGNSARGGPARLGEMPIGNHSRKPTIQLR